MKAPLYTVGYMCLMAAIFTSGITLVKVGTHETIRLNEEARERRVILDALGLLDAHAPEDAAEVARIYEARIVEREIDDMTYYEGYADDARTEFAGYAFHVSGMGLWGRIEGIMAMNEPLDTIIGFAFITQNETPGLGGRIADEPFRGRFRDLPIAEANARDRYVRFVPEDQPDLNPGEIHALTGATQTMNGIETFLNQDIARIKRTMTAVNR